MRKISNQSLIIIITLIASITACAPKMESKPDGVVTASQDDRKLSNSMPESIGTSTFFNSLETHTRKLNLPSLKATVFPNKDDFEVRFWADLLPGNLNGVILRRINNQWFAISIYGQKEHQDFQLTQKKLDAPKSGWDGVWAKLLDADILTLPDASEVNCNIVGLDGLGLAVETNFNEGYRSYYYRNPQRAECDEAKRIISIAQILFDEFAMGKL